MQLGLYIWNSTGSTESAHMQCSLPEQFGALLPDIEELEWATEAFGSPPEATNLWIGTDDSMTSFHKACALLVLGVSSNADETLWPLLTAIVA